MGEFRVYNTLAYQIEPAVQNPDQREDIKQLAKNNVDCYLDLGESRIVCAFEANSSHVSRSRQRFLAEYVADESENLLLGISQQIKALEEGGSTDDWELFRDSSNTVWEFESAQSRSLADLGIDFALELAVEDLVEGGAKLDLGITGHREAAVAVTYFALSSEGDRTVGVSSNGRTPALRSAAVVLEPGVSANFEPLNDRTASLIGERINDEKSRIEEWFESTLHDNLGELIGGDLTHWSLYDEVSELDSALAQEPPELPTQFNGTDQTARIVELSRALQENEQAPGERVSPKVLDQQTREALTEEIIEAVSDTQERIERHAFECTLGVFYTDLSSLESLGRAGEQSALNRARSTLHGASQEASQPDALLSFTNHVTAYQESNLHTPEERAKVTEEIREAVDERLDEIVAEEQREFTGRFEQWLNELTDLGAAEHRSTKLRNAESLLKTESPRGESQRELPASDMNSKQSSRHSNSNSSSSHDGLSADNSSLAGLQSLLKDIRTSEVLSNDEQSSLIQELLNKVQKTISNFRESEKERYRERLLGHVEAVVNADNSIRERYDRLGAMEDLCSGKAISRSGPQIDKFDSDLEAIRTHELFSSSDVKEITTDIEARIEDERQSLVARKRDNIEEDVEKGLDKMLGRLGKEQSSNHTQLYDELRMVRQYLVNDTRELEHSNKPYLRRIKQRIDEITTRNSGSDSLLTRNGFGKVRGSLRNEIKSQLTDAEQKIQHDKLESLKSRIDDRVLALRESRLEVAIKIQFTDYLLEYHKWGSTDTEIQSAEELSDERQDELSDHYRQLSEFAQNPEAGGVDILDETDLNELSNHFKSELSKLRDELCSKLADSLTKEVKQQYEDQVKLAPETVAELTATIDTLEELQREVRTLYNNTHTNSQFLEEDTVRRIKILDTEHKDQFKNDLLEFLNTEIQDLRERRPAMVREEFTQKINKIVNSDVTTKEKFIALSKVGDVLDHRDVETVPVINADPLIEHRHELNRGGYDEITDTIESAQNRLYQNYKESVQATVSQVFEKHAEEATANTSVVADTFVELVDEYQEGNALEETQSVRPAVEKVREIQELEPHLSKQQHEDLRTALRDTVSRYASGSPDRSSTDGYPAGIFSGSDTHSRQLITRVFLLVGVVLLAGGIGALATGGLSPGSSPNTVGGTQITGLDVHETESGELVIAGAIAGNVSELRLQVTGPNVSQNSTVPVNNGEFEYRTSQGESGSYTIELRSASVQGGWTSFTSNVIREANPGGPTLEIKRPSTGSNITPPILINATTNAENITVSLLDNSGSSVSSRTTSVQNGTVDIELDVTATGDHYLIVVAQGDGSTTEVRKIRLYG